MKYDLTIAEWAYFAGIVDGEGSVLLLPNRGNPLPRLEITNTNDELVEWIEQRLDPSKYIRLGRRAEHSTTYQLDWTGIKAVVLLDNIEPYLVIKKRQARIVAGYWHRREEFKGQGTSIVEMVRNLNRRGVKGIP